MQGLPFLFEGKLRDFETQLVSFHLEKAKLGGQSKKVTKIIAYLSIYGVLTQNQLKYLTKFSISTISTTLGNLENLGYVRREFKVGTHEYEYSLAFSTNNSIDDALGSLEGEIKFIHMRIDKLRDLIHGKNVPFLLDRLEELLSVFELYQHIIETPQNSSFDSEKETLVKRAKITIPDLKRMQNRNMEDYDSQVAEIETEIIHFFTHESAYSTIDNLAKKVNAYFFVRPMLTQEELRLLTGLSLGKISQVVNQLLEKAIIRKLDNTELNGYLPETPGRKIHYSISPFLTSSFTSGLNILNKLLKWQPRFIKMQLELREKRKELQSLRGYSRILERFEYHLELLKKYHSIGEQFAGILVEK